MAHGRWPQPAANGARAEPCRERGFRERADGALQAVPAHRAAYAHRCVQEAAAEWVFIERHFSTRTRLSARDHGGP